MSTSTDDSIEQAHPPIDQSVLASKIDAVLRARGDDALPDPVVYQTVTSKLISSLPENGLGSLRTLTHILTFPHASSSATLSKHYYGFVSGGCLPIAESANILVGAMDLNVMVHQPGLNIATEVEDKTLVMLLELLDLKPEEWMGRTLTSGATGSNILGVAAARDELINRVLTGNRKAERVADLGLFEAMASVGLTGVRILSQKAHSSIYKTAGVLGLGRSNVIECGLQHQPWRWDLNKVRGVTMEGGDNYVYIAVVSCGEVDTGFHGTTEQEMSQLAHILEGTRGSGWIHVDGAFGIFGRSLPAGPEFEVQRQGCSGLEYADSIGADAHKCLNVPYDSAFLFTRSLESLEKVCTNGTPAYLNTGNTSNVDSITSPLNINLSNSRRFSALPIYSILISLGREGLSDMFARQIRLARTISWMIHTKFARVLELLPTDRWDEVSKEEWKEKKNQTGIIVLFRAKDGKLNKVLEQRINEQKTCFVSGTRWERNEAVRIAVAGWDAQIEDAKVVEEVLEEAVATFYKNKREVRSI